MDRQDPHPDRRLSRRSLIKAGLAGGTLLLGGEALREALSGSARHAGRTPGTGRRPVPVYRREQPNILVIVVDQMRFPQWLSPTLGDSGLPPSIERLREEGVSFARHYTVSNDCTPARSALLTGLYTHQTGCMITGGSTLDPGLPTYGHMLRELGYATHWFGKWHLTHGDQHWRPETGPRVLARYGFAGGTYPSPDGAPGQGFRVDPHIAGQFASWVTRRGREGPWCTTVSLVNPHDIAWWYVWSDRVRAEATAASFARGLPPNFESPRTLAEQRKPRLQRSLQSTAASSFGPVGFEGPLAEAKWREFMDLYMKLQLTVDRHVGNILAALAAQPDVAANTVVVFTADHGEYAGSHGLRGKGASAYEEAIRVPLIVKDPRGLLTDELETERIQLTSSVDVAPLLLTIAAGGSHWREDPRRRHLARRLDLARILADPSAAGRHHVLHATDEVVTEYALETYAADAPLHVVALRTAEAKYATYSDWIPGTIQPLTSGAETELYDYTNQRGRLELENLAGRSGSETHLSHLMRRAIAGELREPLPRYLHAAQRRGFADYFTTAKRSAVAVTAVRRRRRERLFGPLPREQDIDETLRSRPVT